MGWTTPEDVRAQVERLWERGRILSAHLDGGPLFPLAIRMRRPSASDLTHRFDEVRAWIRRLESGSQDGTYRIEWADINHRQVGRNRVPQGLVVPSEADGLALIGKRRQVELFDALVQSTRESRPELLPWIARRPLELLGHADDWPRILAVLEWFCQHPAPGIYLRQLDVPGVHTKFIEARRGVFTELLDLCLPSHAVCQEATGVAQFERRYGLRSKPALIRFRVLDPGLCVAGLDDVTTPASQFAGLELPARRVFITENDINALAFPAVPGGIVVFGLGYGLERLRDIPWLQGRSVHYWGDLDTHGFAILDELRGHLPQARSFLMDRQTLLAHRALWVEEADPCASTLARLTEEEGQLYDDLRRDRLGPRVRLEQERISFGYLQRALRCLIDECPA